MKLKIGNKKNKAKEDKEKDEPKVKKERKKREVEKHEGSRWSSVILLLIVVLISGAVWIYGSMSSESGDDVKEKTKLGVSEVEKVSPTELNSKTVQSNSSEVMFEENPGF